MRHRAWRSLALASWFALALAANTRPRYGGTLRIQVLDLPDFERSPLVAETLVRIDRNGEADGWLARTWEHDAARRRWRFALQPNVVLHDGRPLTNELAASILAAKLKLTCFPVGRTLVAIQGNGPVPDLLERLANPAAAISVKGDNNLPVGTGPFRVTLLEPGRRALLAANENYWGGRPFVDGVEFTVAPARATAAAYQIAAADIWQLPVAIGRRLIPDRMHVWASEPRELIAIAMPGVPAPVREALAGSIDRQAIVDVLTQHRGEIAYGLLPQWLTGYEFLFASRPDVAHARELLAGWRERPLTIAAPPGDWLARMIADRIAVNARDAGLTLLPGSRANPDIRLFRLRLASNNAAQSLIDLADALGLGERLRGMRLGTPDELYWAEESLLEDHAVVPILYLPDLYGYGPRVRGWESAERVRDGLLHVEDLWVTP
jgi:peptide/nickel transport system substrate-binding protein